MLFERMSMSISIPFRFSLQFLLCLLLLLLNYNNNNNHLFVDASITIADSGKILDSKAEKHLGTQLWKGYEYVGRAQYISTNLQLCKLEGQSSFAIKAPKDSLPVALIAKSGGCSLEEKALVASTMINPPNAVAYLIVDDYGSKKSRKKAQRTWLSTEDDVETYEDDDDQDNNFNNNNDESTNPFWPLQYTSEEDEWVKYIWGDDEKGEAIMIQDNVIIGKQHAENHHKQQSEKTWFGIDDNELKSPLSFSYVPSDDEGIKYTQNTQDTIIVSDDETPPPLMETNDENPVIFADDKVEDGMNKDEGPIVPSPPVHTERYTTFMTLNDDATSIHEDEEPPESHRVLRAHKKKSHNGEISVAIFHVSYKSGYELLNVVLKQNAETREMGGPKIYLNTRYPQASAKTIFLWTVLTIAVAGGGCCCLMVLISQGIEEPRPAPPRPVRRRLTYEQVRASHPSFRFNPEVHVQSNLDECAICLDDFVENARCRQLPCQHIFHSACIGRWLVERSATCPLCKIDLYEEESSDEESEPEATNEPELTFMDWMRNLGLAGEVSGVTPPTATTNVAATTTATTTATSSWWPSGNGISTTSWWASSATGTTPSTPVAPTPPTPIATNGDITTTDSRPRRGGIWRLNFFGQTTRRREGEGMLTELTEPLMAGESSQRRTEEEQQQHEQQQQQQQQQLEEIPPGASIPMTTLQPREQNAATEAESTPTTAEEV